MIEVTNYCNLKCDYCHASTVSAEEKELKKKTKINKEVIKETLKMIFQTPSNSIKIELQGGEPLVSWESCKYIIENAYNMSLNYINKKVEIILCTNLILINEEILFFLKKYDVHISTSLDGTKSQHDKHRKTHSNKSTYDKFIKNLELSRKILGFHNISALLTVTKSNLNQLKEVIDEYVKLNFNGVFIRALNPYGMATKNLNTLGYSTEEFFLAYKNALEYIIKINNEGIFFIDYYSLLLFKRIFTPFSTGFMDFQSPAGAGISGVIYDFIGNVYPTDESRMLARMGDDKFLIGNVLKDSYESIFLNKKLIEITKKSVLHIIPSCNKCIYNLYCGSDPIRNYVENNDIIGHKPTSGFCKKNMFLFNYLFKLIYQNDMDTINVFWSWINMKNLGEIRV